VTFEEALAELGIAADAAPDQARRAYLRLLKTRKPETDPQGFMRLREAYEQIKQRLEWRDTFMRAHVVAEAIAPEPEAAPAPAPEEPPRDEPAIEAREPEATPEPAVEASPEEEPHAEERQEEEQRDQREREQCDREQRDRESRDREQRDREQRDREEREQEHRAPPPNPANIHALMSAGHHEEAAEELARLFEHALERSADATPFVSMALRLILMLFAQSRAPAAAALGASLFDYLRGSGHEARAVRGADAARWTILRELAALSPKFPDTVRSAIARGALADDLGSASGELAKLQLRKPGAAAKAALALRQRAPVIAAALADVLDPPAPAPTPPRAAPPARGSWAFAAMAIGLIRVIMMLARTDSSPSAYEPPRYQPTYQPSKLTPTYDPALMADILDAGLPHTPWTPLDDSKARALSRVDRVQARVAAALAADAGRRSAGYEALSKSAAEVDAAVQREDCGAARAHARAVIKLFTAGGALARVDAVTEVVASELQTEVIFYCDALDASRRPGARKP
jgi:chemotaxis protein histidine kinase CheA